MRPLGLGEILGGAFTSVRRNLPATFGLAALVMALYGIVSGVFNLLASDHLRSVDFQSISRQLQAGQQPTHQQIAAWVSLMIWVGIAGASVGVASFLLNSALTGALSGVVGSGLLGRRVSIGDAWRQGRVGAAIGTGLLELVLAICVPLPIAAAVVVLALAHLAPLAAFVAVAGGIAVMVFEIVLLTRLTVALPIAVLERATPATAIGRSWALTRGSFWRMIGILIVAGLVEGAVSLAVQVPFTVVEVLATGHSVSVIDTTGYVPAATIIIGAIGAAVGLAVAAPIATAVFVLLYADLRMRREGLASVLTEAAARGQSLTTDELARVWARPGNA